MDAATGGCRRTLARRCGGGKITFGSKRCAGGPHLVIYGSYLNVLSGGAPQGWPSRSLKSARLYSTNSCRERRVVRARAATHSAYSRLLRTFRYAFVGPPTGS